MTAHKHTWRAVASRTQGRVQVDFQCPLCHKEVSCFYNVRANSRTTEPLLRLAAVNEIMKAVKLGTDLPRRHTPSDPGR